MKPISIANDIVPIGEFKTSLSKWFNTVSKTGHPLIITQNGKPAGVLLSPKD
jgi:prevent-host-death family protein